MCSRLKSMKYPVNNVTRVPNENCFNEINNHRFIVSEKNVIKNYLYPNSCYVLNKNKTKISIKYVCYMVICNKFFARFLYLYVSIFHIRWVFAKYEVVKSQIKCLKTKSLSLS